MNTLNLSVIICTHNPRRDYFARVLQALKSQTLSKHLWELLVIDNASNQLLSSDIDLSWHPQARHFREDQLGLTPARLRGIQEATAEILVFVDDDNVLDSDYLEVALRISKDWSTMGAWGGQTIPEFEERPPDWTKPYWGYLAIREFERDSWSNLLHQYQTTPCGAGLCVRRTVAEKYTHLVRNDPRRLNMGRKGELLLSCEDSDIAFTACDMGLGTGQFTSLKLTHLIPTSRLEEEYLMRLCEGLSYSYTILASLWGNIPPRKSWIRKLVEHYKAWEMNSRERRIYKAQIRGYDRAIQEILNTKI